MQIYASNDSTGGYANAIATDADVDTVSGTYAQAIVTSIIIIATAVAAGAARETFFVPVPVSYSFVDSSGYCCAAAWRRWNAGVASYTGIYLSHSYAGGGAQGANANTHPRTI
ncbi:hypothetical protein ccbrp13_31590 [Ktedonobacteria bacterium brp13]|nr:hypothetical protein ccbrp13_31590 [Ktedonobacteria bacterium brp13]